MKKTTSLLLCIMLILSVFTPVFASNEKIDGLITFDGYAARKSEFNGIRAQYSLDTSALKTLEKSYNVTIGVLTSGDISESSYTDALTLSKATVNKVFYSTDKGYIGTYYDKTATDNKYEFVYAITFNEDDASAVSYYSKPVSMRAYVTLTSGSNTETYYIDNTSTLFGYSVSMNELATYFVNTYTDNFPMLQRVVNNSLKKAKINNTDIDKFSIVVQKEEDINYGKEISNAVKSATGYSLPVCVSTPHSTEAYILLDKTASLANNTLYEISANKSIITVKAKETDSIVSAITKLGEELAKDKVIDTTITETFTRTFKVTYGEGSLDFITVNEGESFSIPVVTKSGYSFIGYFTADDIQVADLEGNSLADFILDKDITVTAKYNRLPTEADSSTGQLLGNPLATYYKSATFTNKIARNPWDLVVYDGKVYLGGGYYGGAWISAPPISVYDTETNQWDNVDFAVKMYEAFNPDNTTKSWYTLPSTKSDSKNVSNKNAGVIPVTTDCEISNFRILNGKPITFGADSINGYTWADGIVSTAEPTDGQKSVANNLGNYYIVEEDENGNDRWVEYRNNVLHGVHVYDAIEVDYKGSKTLMFAVGTSGTPMPAKILSNKDKKSYVSPKFYLKDGTLYDGTNSNNRIYNFFKTDEGIFAYYAHQGGTAKKIFKYNVVNNEHRFDEVRDITVGYGEGRDFRTYVQNDVDSNGNAVTSRRLWTDFIRTESFNGYAYITTGNFYKAKTFNDIKSITAPNSAVVTDLIVRDGVLYALGFKKNNSTTNAYTNYIWSIDTSDKFTEIRNFTSTGAYALSFDKDAEFFYVGLGGPTTHITDSVKNVGNIIKLSINPVQ